MDSFSSTQNKDYIFSIIRKDVQTNLGSDLTVQAKDLVQNAMDFIKTRVSPKTPANMNDQQYKNLMNKKVIDLVLPVIYQGGFPDKPNKQNIPNKQNESRRGRKLDEGINQHQMGFQDMLPHPASQTRSDLDLVKQYERLENDRQERKPERPNFQNPYPNAPAPEQSILPQRPDPKNRIKSVQDRFQNSDRYISSSEAAEPNLNIHQMRRKKTQGTRTNQNNNILNKIDDNEDEELNKFLDEISQEIDDEDNQELDLSTNIDFDNKGIKEVLPENKEVTQNGSNIQALINKKIDPNVNKNLERQIDVGTKIEIDYSAPHNLYQEQSGAPIEQTNRVVNNEIALKEVNRMEDNFSNQTDIQMLKQINHIKSPYLDDQTIAKANTYASTFPIIPANRTRYIIKEHYITIDSRDRDLEIYPDPTLFQVKFEPAADSIEKKTVIDKNNNFIYNGLTRFISDDRGASLNKKFDNILSIQLICAIIPLQPQWVCGNCPSKYNNTFTDENLGDFSGIPNGPVYTPDVGVVSTILDEPYLLLKVKELESYSPYYGTNTVSNNSFAKLVYMDDFGRLASFVKFGTCSENEKFIFGPHTLNSIDKMTLDLIKCTGVPLTFDDDKTFLKSISEGNVFRNCNRNSTRITVGALDECDPCEEQGHCLVPGDIVYFYRVKPNCENIINLNPEITIDCINFIEDMEGDISELIEIVLAIQENGHYKDKPLALGGIIVPGDYLSISYKNLSTGEKKKEIIKIRDVQDNIIRIKVQDFQAREDLESIDIISLGIAKSNPKGTQSQDKNCLEYVDGMCVCNVIDKFNFEISLPFTKLPSELTDGNVFNEYFFIKHKLQVSYTFKIETKEKDYFEIDSEAVF